MFQICWYLPEKHLFLQLEPLGQLDLLGYVAWVVEQYALQPNASPVLLSLTLLLCYPLLSHIIKVLED